MSRPTTGRRVRRNGISMIYLPSKEILFSILKCLNDNNTLLFYINFVIFYLLVWLIIQINSLFSFDNFWNWAGFNADRSMTHRLSSLILAWIIADGNNRILFKSSSSKESKFDIFDDPILIDSSKVFDWQFFSIKAMYLLISWQLSQLLFVEFVEFIRVYRVKRAFYTLF
jgi:hypothetical protein